MGFWDNLLGGVVGRAPKTFDPYEQARPTLTAQHQKAMGDYDKMVATPGGAIPEDYRQKMLGDVEKDVRNRYAGQGQSGFTEDRVVKGQNDLRVKMLGTELDQLNKQRDYMQQLTGMTVGMPTQSQPGETGMAQKFGSDLAGRAGRGVGDAIFGKEQEDDDEAAKVMKMFGAFGNDTRGGGQNSVEY